MFDCGDNTCIDINLKCNGYPDCATKHDEKDCPTAMTCPGTNFTCNNGICITEDKVCDYNNDCGDSSDESEQCCKYYVIIRHGLKIALARRAGLLFLTALGSFLQAWAST